MQYIYRSDTGQEKILELPLKDDKPPYVEDEAGVKFHRVFHAHAVIYNAMGFYKTDNLGPIEKWRKENMQGM